MSHWVDSRLSLRASKLALITVSLFGVLSVLYKHGNDFEGSSVARLVQRRTAVSLPDRKVLIWLLGYPGAGTDNTIEMVERATHKSMATNYGSTVQTRDMASHTNVYVSQWLQKVWYKEGVFINNVDYEADTPQVYVKTFCTGYCLYEPDSGFCPRIPYVRQLLDVGKFWEECARGDIYLPPRTRKWNKTYWRNRVKKVLVLVRSPMELVTSRFLVYARQNGAKRARLGLLPYCDMLDKLYKDVKEVKKMANRRYMRDIMLDGEATGVPCWTEFFRIFYWYANAWEIADGRESMVKYYEDFVNNPIRTATDILNYAGLTRVEGKEIRPIGDEVEIWFTDEEKGKISLFMQALGRFESPMWPEYFARYF